MRQRSIHCAFTRVAVAILGIALAAGAHADDAKKPAADVYGDALPDGARMRMGSMRWRHGEPITFLAYPPNGKTLITAANDATLLIWERRTGKLLHRLTTPGELPRSETPVNIYAQTLTRAAMTADGKLLAVVLPNNAVQLWEVETGKAVRQIKGPANSRRAMSFSPDGKILAMCGSDRWTYLYDTETGKQIRKLTAKSPNSNLFGSSANEADAAFAPDGKTLAVPEIEVINNRVVTYIAFFETATGKELRRIDLPTSRVNSLAFSPDGKRFAYNGNNMVYLVAADTGKEVHQFNSNFGANFMVFAPDSETLALKGRDQTVRLYGAATGNHLQTFGGNDAKANNVIVSYNRSAVDDVVFVPDGKTIVIGGSQTPRFFDVGTAKELDLPSGELPSGGHRGAVSNVLAAPDGKTLVSRGADHVVRVWNTADGVDRREFAEPAGTCCVAISPDAKLVALGNADGTIRLINAADGKQIRQLKGHPNSTAALTFSADGKTLASRGSFDGLLRIFDVDQGNELKQITWQTINPGNGRAVLVRSGSFNTTGNPLLFSPDGQTLVTYVAPQPYYVQGQPQQQPGANCLRFWSVATGKEIRQIEIPSGRTINHLAYSPDGRLLISENSDKTVSLWETASGRERTHLGQPIAAPVVTTTTAFIVLNGVVRNGQAAAPAGTTIAVSPDGSLIASPGPDHSIHVWDTALGKEIGSFKGHHRDIACLSFAPDGKTLISGGKDTTILVWDLARLKREPRPASADLQPKTLDALWADLIGSDAVTAGKSIHKLTSAPKSALAFLNDHLKPAAPIDPKKIEQWIVELDSSAFAKRSAAMSQLEKLGDLAIPALKKVLTGKSSLEMRRRVEPLLEKLASGSFSAEQIRILRAIEVLDKIGTPEATQMLEHLAGGAPGALTTRQAQAALDRHASASRRP